MCNGRECRFGVVLADKSTGMMESGECVSPASLDVPTVVMGEGVLVVAASGAAAPAALARPLPCPVPTPASLATLMQWGRCAS